MTRLTAPVLMLTLAVAGCGRLGDSAAALNPLRWFGGGTDERTTLEPREGYARAIADGRPGIARITGAEWQAVNEGRLLVVTSITPTKGYWKAELVAETPDPTGRLRPDPDGVLRLRFVAWPPPEGSAAARMAANPPVDTITAAVTLSHTVLDHLQQVTITGADNAVTLRK